MARLRNAVLVVSAVCLALACASTRQTRKAEPSGFLGDYSQLRPGEGGGPQLIFIDAEADFSPYDAIEIDSVTLWATTEKSALSPEEQKLLTDHLYHSLHEELSKDYRMVEEPEPGAMRLRAAITEAEGARVVRNTVTTVLPQARLIGLGAQLTADTAVLVGRAGLEVEISDALTGARLAAGVSRRVGTKSLGNIGSKWADVEDAFDTWAARIRERLAELRQGR